MRMTNESWESAACGAIERKLFKIMILNNWESQRFVDDDARQIWTSMYTKFIEEYPNYSYEKKQWLIEKFLEEYPNFLKDNI